MNRGAIALSIIALGVSGSLVAGCGGEGAEKAATGKDLTKVLCPLAPTGEVVDGVPRYEPAPGAFDTAELVGLELEAAQKKAAEHGCGIVVASEDGKALPVSVEVDPTQIYVYTERDAVTRIEGVGGGL